MPTLPKNVKEQEKYRLNACWFPLEDMFTPVVNVPYLWVATEDQIIIGIEKPWEHPEAFVDPDDYYALAEIMPILHDMELHGRLGHPTLATEFQGDGTVNAKRGRAIMAGELILDRHDICVINNDSGRFDMSAVLDEEAAKKKLIEIRRSFEQKLPSFLSFELHYYYPKKSHSKHYNEIVAVAGSNFEATINLLIDYLDKAPSQSPYASIYTTRNTIDQTVSNVICDFEKSSKLDQQQTALNVYESLLHALQSIDAKALPKSLNARLDYIQTNLCQTEPSNTASYAKSTVYGSL